MLNTMLFPNELVNTDEIETSLSNNIELSEKEVEMPRHLVSSMTGKFEPANIRMSTKKKLWP